MGNFSTDHPAGQEEFFVCVNQIELISMQRMSPTPAFRACSRIFSIPALNWITGEALAA
jgi:hypothetical protein